MPNHADAVVHCGGVRFSGSRLLNRRIRRAGKVGFAIEREVGLDGC